MKTNDAVFLFDSHSRGKQGRIADAVLSSLLQLPSIENVGHYVSSVYLSHNTRIPYEFQIVTISTLQPLPPQENNDSNYLSTPSFHNLCLVPSASSSKMRPSKRASKEQTKFTNKRICIHIPTTSHCVDILSCPISADKCKIIDLKHLILSAICTSLFIPVSKWTNTTINLIIEHSFPLLSLETRIDQQSGVMYYAEIGINFTCQSQRFTYQTFLSDIANQWSVCSAAILSATDSLHIGLLKEQAGNKVALFQIPPNKPNNKEMPQGNCQVELLVFKCSSLLLNYVKSAFICDKKGNFEVQFITMDTPLNKSLRRKFEKNFSYPTISRNGNLPKTLTVMLQNFSQQLKKDHSTYV